MRWEIVKGRDFIVTEKYVAEEICLEDTRTLTLSPN